MKDDMKGWVRESEFTAQRAKEAAALAETCKAEIRQLALIVRDIVYIVRATGGEHDDVLSEHQDRLSEIIGIDDNG